MRNHYSPLRYPGGKACLTPFFRKLIAAAGIRHTIFAEPFAGGAGAAIHLLLDEYVDCIVLNDFDVRIVAMWESMLRAPDRFAEFIETTSLTIDEWRKQRAIYLRGDLRSRFRLGCATFYLNRCNRSGIIPNGGPIGGTQQLGTWKLDARFNREELIRRVLRLSEFADRIELHNRDGLEFMRSIVGRRCNQERHLVYVDPPYFGKGDLLYKNSLTPARHRRIAEFFRHWTGFRWVVSYDDAPEIRSYFEWLDPHLLGVEYSAAERRVGKELLFIDQRLEETLGSVATMTAG